MTNEEFQTLVLSELRDIKRDVGTLKEDVGILKNDVILLKEDVNLLKEDVNFLKEDVTILKQDVGSLKESVARIEHRLDAVFEETAGLAEFRTEVKTDLEKHGRLLDILSRRSLLQESEIIDLRMAK